MYYGEKANKAAFAHELGELMQRYGVCDIVAIHYRSADNGDATRFDEELLVTYAYGDQRIINVNMDSIDGMMRDLFNQEAFGEVY